jgi:hypothetical protein
VDELRPPYLQLLKETSPSCDVSQPIRGRP